jgi:hypothetical protein
MPVREPGSSLLEGHQSIGNQLHNFPPEVVAPDYVLQTKSDSS